MRRSDSYIAVPPGATIKEQLDDRNMSQKEFAARMDMSEKHISKLINGEVQLTKNMSERLEVVLGIPAGFWNNLEAIYREQLEKVKQENEMKEDEQIAKQFPYNEMVKYGWIPTAKNVKEKAENLRKYFSVVNLASLENPQITKVACRRLAVTDKADLALLSWIQEAKIESRNINTRPVDKNKIKRIIPELRKLTLSTPEEFCEPLKDILSECGIALVFLPHIKGSFLHGATFLNGNKIVVGLTVRGKYADKFWFSLFHEMGHIVLGHLDRKDEILKKDEEEADKWAENALIPSDSFDEFKQKNKFDEKSVSAYAQKIGIAPGIVVGRLQNDKYISYTSLNHLKEKYTLSE